MKAVVRRLSSVQMGTSIHWTLPWVEPVLTKCGDASDLTAELGCRAFPWGKSNVPQTQRLTVPATNCQWPSPCSSQLPTPL